MKKIFLKRMEQCGSVIIIVYLILRFILKIEMTGIITYVVVVPSMLMIVSDFIYYYATKCINKYINNENDENK